jgi:hypothetical protein
VGKVVVKREYADGDCTLVAEVLDNGCVALTAKQSGPWVSEERPAAVSAAVLRQLADLADASRA